MKTTFKLLQAKAIEEYFEKSYENTLWNIELNGKELLRPAFFFYKNLNMVEFELHLLKAQGNVLLIHEEKVWGRFTLEIILTILKNGLSCQTNCKLEPRAQPSLPSGHICSYSTMFKSLCPSSYCCDLRLRAHGQKVSNGALDLACHVLPRLPLILLLWAVEEYGSCTPFIPATIKI